MKYDYWRTKDGKEIAIKDMTTEHIKNCIKALQEDRITIGYTISIGYTADGDGDGEMFEFINCADDYIEAFKEELLNRI